MDNLKCKILNVKCKNTEGGDEYRTPNPRGEIILTPLWGWGFNIRYL
jgi:hypothetical protein